MTDTGTYLYAIARSTGENPAEGLSGVGGTPVRTVERGGLTGIVSTVPLDEFGERALRRNLEDLRWLETTARAHHQVVDAVVRRVTAAPVRLVTVYRGDEQVRDLLERRREEFTEMLDMVTGRREWGVKVYVDPQVAARSSPSDAAGGASAGRRSSGAAYLERRRTDLRTREQSMRRALSQAEQVDEALATIAVASRRHRPQDPQLSGRQEWMVLNGAYLVDDERGGEFASVAGSLRTPEIDVELTGPWAPYSFTILESGESGESGEPGEPGEPGGPGRTGGPDERAPR
ncbi:Gas vesicle synthesis protein GvpL/GvpF [Thermomonospora echinospora]|uniref:Gas vesicle synthesis protein GvpL/GvpF n=1 Tax=Thermomonospora echinospora TaxID=1992 RepID=A0A1H6CJF7_9ACTN|nr:GvpL/GvpF family gas vesicle protein [Thermomonospora echinospora]SEG72903.1 Gas vesicle synthesis protein GvpL/GvpF [Thermomonospora echinospora]